MRSRASRSTGDSKRTSRQESSKSSSATSSESTSAKSDSTPSESSESNGSLHRPGSMTNNVSHTLQQNVDRGASLDRRIATARIDRVVPPKP